MHISLIGSRAKNTTIRLTEMGKFHVLYFDRVVIIMITIMILIYRMQISVIFGKVEIRRNLSDLL